MPTMTRVALLLGRRGRCGAGGRRPFSSSGAADEELGSLPLGAPAVCIWGSNTGVGKTLFSAGLAAAARRAKLPLLYLKPAQTGFPADSDARLVGAAAGLPLAAGPHAAHLDSLAAAAEASASPGDASLAKTLYAWGQPISPHLAVQREGRPVGDRQLAADVAAELRAFAAAARGGLTVVETAGGVASPGPSGTLQASRCELLRPLSLPGLLVGDGRLGGISATLSAYDSLVLRGHHVPLLVLMEEGGLDNAAAIQQQLGAAAAVLSFPPCRPPPPPAAADGAPPPAIDASLAAWLAESQPQFDRLLGAVAEAHRARVGRLARTADDARRMLWWPFTQHGNVSGVTVIDSRVGEHFSVYQPGPAAAGAAAGSQLEPGPATEDAQNASSGGGGGDAGSGSLQLLYDSCASWWTQGVSQRAHPQLVRAVSAAAARYGHLMFPENAHEPAVELARQLLDGVGAGWATRVFYSDNGSTAIEVALKMAFRKYLADHQLLEQAAAGPAGSEEEAGGGLQLEVLGLREAYHGDTLGAMEAVAPSPYNGPLQQPWYRGRGTFLDPPTVSLQRGAWRVAVPRGVREAAARRGQQPEAWQLEFDGRAGVFDLVARMGDAPRDEQDVQGGSLYRSYLRHVLNAIDEHAGGGGGPPQAGGEGGGARRRLGACILEPVLQGAGGMRLVDPLYQRAMVQACRWRGIPVIFDEVFTGCWRLGTPSGARLLGVHPDLACYAKLMTGGLVPLAATLATEEVFAVFEGDSKFRALLHGHSYTAHPIGCAAGVAALQLYRDPALNPNWCTPDAPGRCRQQAESPEADQGCQGPCGQLAPLWDEARVAALSAHPRVRGVVALGTVLAVQLRAEGPSGYASNAAAEVVARLRGMGVYGRPLGDVAYLMVTPMTERRQCDALLAKLAAALG